MFPSFQIQISQHKSATQNDRQVSESDTQVNHELVKKSIRQSCGWLWELVRVKWSQRASLSVTLIYSANREFCSTVTLPGNAASLRHPPVNHPVN